MHIIHCERAEQSNIHQKGELILGFCLGPKIKSSQSSYLAASCQPSASWLPANRQLATGLANSLHFPIVSPLLLFVKTWLKLVLTNDSEGETMGKLRELPATTYSH